MADETIIVNPHVEKYSKLIIDNIYAYVKLIVIEILISV